MPIIAMTANVFPEQIARCLEAGMDGHLGKPINPAKFIETGLTGHPKRMKRPRDLRGEAVSERLR